MDASQRTPALRLVPPPQPSASQVADASARKIAFLRSELASGRIPWEPIGAAWTEEIGWLKEALDILRLPEYEHHPMEMARRALRDAADAEQGGDWSYRLRRFADSLPARRH